MEGKPNGRFWGKLKSTDGHVEAWHPLVDHCADVAACCELLYELGCIQIEMKRCGIRVLLSKRANGCEVRIDGTCQQVYVRCWIQFTQCFCKKQRAVIRIGGSHADEEGIGFAQLARLARCLD